MAEYYLWFKFLHIVSVIGWAGSMILLPWLYVILVQSRANPDHELMMLEVIRFVIKRFINVTMILTIISGLILYSIVANSGVESFGWLHAKLTLVLLLFACHGVLARSYRRMVQHGYPPSSARFYHHVGWATLISVILIVYLAILKPM